MYEYTAKVERVVDGDTIVVNIDLGFTVFVTQRIRLSRINAPEMKTEEGPPSKAFLADLIEGKVVVIRTSKLPDKSKDNYGRYIADVVIGNLVINDLIVQKGFADYVSY